MIQIDGGLVKEITKGENTWHNVCAPFKNGRPVSKGGQIYWKNNYKLSEDGKQGRLQSWNNVFPSRSTLSLITLSQLLWLVIEFDGGSKEYGRRGNSWLLDLFLSCRLRRKRFSIMSLAREIKIMPFYKCQRLVQSTVNIFKSRLQMPTVEARIAHSLHEVR